MADRSLHAIAVTRFFRSLGVTDVSRSLAAAPQRWTFKSAAVSALMAMYRQQ